MEIRNIESLTPNPENHRILTKEGKEMLLYAMSLGDHSTFLITPEGMIIDGNNRWEVRTDAGWEDKDVYCRILTYGQDSEGYYAIIDGETVKEAEVIPHHFVSVEALYKAFSFTRNSEAAYDDPDYIANHFHEWQLDPDRLQVSLFKPQSLTETLKSLEKRVNAKKYQLIIPCESEEDMDQKFAKITELGYQIKRKI